MKVSILPTVPIVSCTTLNQSAVVVVVVDAVGRPLVLSFSTFLSFSLRRFRASASAFHQLTFARNYDDVNFS